MSRLLTAFHSDDTMYVNVPLARLLGEVRVIPVYHIAIK